jgi:hypothetical protein
MMQSGHGSGHDVPVWKWIERDRKIVPIKPTLDGEPNYEDHPVNPWPTWDPANGYFDDYDVRKQIYRSVFAGACGVTYGHHSVWQFASAREGYINHAKMPWTQALDRPGAFQAGLLRRLVESRPMLNRMPDQLIVIKGQGDKGEHIECIRGSNDSYALIYIPVGKNITVKTDFIKTNKIQAWWFNPKNGEVENIGELSRKNEMTFIPPTLGFGNDWVLVLDDLSYAFGKPAK